MGCGIRLNNSKKTSSQNMSRDAIKPSARLGFGMADNGGIPARFKHLLLRLAGVAQFTLYGVVTGIALPLQVMASEVLQSISDESVSVTIKLEDEQKADRHFSYRVICSPDDEPLPDCDAQADKVADGEKPVMELPIPDLPPDAADLETDQPKLQNSSAAVERNKPQKKTPAKKAKKQATKSGKKTAAKAGVKSKRTPRKH